MGAQEVTVQLADEQLSLYGLHEVTQRMFDYMEQQGAKGHPLFPFVSYEGLFHWLEDLQDANRLNVYLKDRMVVGVIGYQVVNLPWTNHKCLQELFIFTVDPRFCGFGRIALERLNELAVEHDCSLIATGSFMNYDPILTKNLYMKKGKFDFSYPAFIKLVD